MNIAIFGGTFNPIHKGHLFLAEQAEKILGLNKVIFVPAYIPPHKSCSDIISAAERFHMIKLAISGRKSFSVSCLEIEKRKKIYSVDTVRYFKKKFPNHTRLFFLIGADQLKGLSSWKDADKLIGLCEFVVFSRPGFSLKENPHDIKVARIEELDISSTQVRDRIKNNKSIKRFVPKSVADYIMSNNLYK
jgi:nicotinate-nucleotide adenylyltransferase